MEIKHFDALSTKELFEIYRLRSEVFIVEQTCVYQDVDDKDPLCWHLMHWENHQLVVYLRILPKGLSFEEVSIGRIITHKDYRGKGLSKSAIGSAIDFIKTKLGSNAIRISAQAYLLDFYQQIGFVPVSETYREDDILHIEMLYGKPSKALVIIDVQKAMKDCFGGAWQIEEILQNISELLATARLHHVPVIYIQHSEPEGEFSRKSVTWDICDEIAPMPKEPIFEKLYCDAFKETELASYLKSQGIRELLLTGLQTEYCMDTTIRTAFSRGYVLKGVKGGHSTFDHEPLNAKTVIEYHESIWDQRFLELMTVESAKNWLKSPESF